jgi:hypothetical protein
VADALQFFLSLKHGEISQSRRVIHFQQFLSFREATCSTVTDAIHRTQNRAAQFFQTLYKSLIPGGRRGKQMVEPISEGSVVGASVASTPMD